MLTDIFTSWLGMNWCRKQFPSNSKSLIQFVVVISDFIPDSDHLTVRLSVDTFETFTSLNTHLPETTLNDSLRLSEMNVQYAHACKLAQNLHVIRGTVHTP